MPENRHKKHFLNLPKYIGGSQALKEFISHSLSYPPGALENGIEGSVIVEYEISDEGVVLNPRVIKGLGHGCDEEAMRVVSLLRFEKVKNRGVRVRVTTKTTINFRLPGVRISYSVSEKSKTETEGKDSGPKSYEYTINL
jgi:TonB family protein